MSPSPLLSEQQPAGVSTAESECSGSSHSKRSFDAKAIDETAVEVPKETRINSVVEMRPQISTSASERAPFTRSSLKRLFSNPLPKRSSTAHNETERRHTTGSPNILNLSLSTSSRKDLGDSAPTILIRAPSADAIESKPIRSIMTSRTLHESLHRGARSTRPTKRSGSISFGQVNIREYERILGDNPSVTSGPPLSIGWRYAPQPIKISVDNFESGKGQPRSSAEYLVPKAVREKILQEHADASRREIASTVRTINRQKQQRRKTVVNIPMASTEEKIEKVKRGVMKAIGSRSSYTKEEAKLWDEAHVVAMEKARRLEESIRNGEKLSMREVYKVGTPWNNVVPSVRNLKEEGGEEIERTETESLPSLQDAEVSIHTQSETLVNDLYRPARIQHKRRGSIDSGRSSNRMVRFDQNFRRSDSDLARPSKQRGKSDIVASENDNDVDDIFAKLVLDESTKSLG